MSRICSAPLACIDYIGGLEGVIRGVAVTCVGGCGVDVARTASKGRQVANAQEKFQQTNAVQDNTDATNCRFDSGEGNRQVFAA